MSDYPEVVCCFNWRPTWQFHILDRASRVDAQSVSSSKSGPTIVGENEYSSSLVGFVSAPFFYLMSFIALHWEGTCLCTIPE